MMDGFVGLGGFSLVMRCDWKLLVWAWKTTLKGFVSLVMGLC